MRIKTITVPPGQKANVIARCGELDFYIPQGAPGPQGPPGQPGAPGTPATVTVTGTTGTPCTDPPRVENTSTNPSAATLEFYLPMCPPLNAAGFNSTTSGTAVTIAAGQSIPWLLNRIVGTDIKNTVGSPDITLTGGGKYYHVNFNINVSSTVDNGTVNIGLYLNTTRIYQLTTTLPKANTLQTINWSGDFLIPEGDAILNFKAENSSVTFGKWECTCSVKEFYF